jgi:hypothetical protein
VKAETARNKFVRDELLQDTEESQSSNFHLQVAVDP